MDRLLREEALLETDSPLSGVTGLGYLFPIRSYIEVLGFFCFLFLMSKEMSSSRSPGFYTRKQKLQLLSGRPNVF